MSKRFLAYLGMISLLTTAAQAQLFRVPFSAGRGLVQASRETLSALPAVEERVAKQIYALTRSQFRPENDFLATVPLGLVQIKLPNQKGVTGTGFLFEKNGRLFVAMSYHVGGRVGRERTVRVFSQSGEPKEYSVTINANGNAGWHSADISIAELPVEALAHGARPLPLGKAEVSAPIFSLGYTAGSFEQQEFVPIRGRLLSAEGYNFEVARELIAGEQVTSPFLFSGYCGSPLLQRQNGAWKVVGLCAGGYVSPGNPTGNKTFAVDLFQTMPPLLDTYLHKIPLPSRGLYFKGWMVDRLAWTELISDVEIWRNGERIFVQNLYHYPGPYSDEHSELALADFVPQSGDVIRYTVRVSHGKTRYAEFVVP